jgi:hypothetical protein
LDLERQKLAMQADRDTNHHMLEMARLEMEKATRISVRSNCFVSRSCVRFIRFQVVINCAGQVVLIAMEKLGPKEQESIRKLSDVRHVANLTKAGLNQDELEAMDRPTIR